MGYGSDDEMVSVTAAAFGPHKEGLGMYENKIHAKKGTGNVSF